MISCPPTKSPAKRPRSRTVSTPPRPDGTSAHFHPKVEDSDEALAASEPNESSAPPSQKKKKKRPPRPYADPSEYAHLGDDPLPDYLDQGLAVLLCGINPGVKSAQLGLHCASRVSLRTEATSLLSRPCADLTPFAFSPQMPTRRTTTGAACPSRA